MAPAKFKAKTTNAANAAGLKICFFKGAKINFEAIAIAPARARIIYEFRSTAGTRIKKRISDVIAEDSELTGTPNIFEKIKFEM
jgi:hypothetical protein